MPIAESIHPPWHRISACLDAPITEICRLSNSTSGPTFRISCTIGRFFVKLCREADVLAAEHDGLASLLATHAIRVPKPMALATFDSISALVSEYIELSGLQTDYPLFAAQLYFTHSQHGSRFGWHRNNYIGPSQQINTQCDSWCEFFLNHRLNVQLRMAARNGYANHLQSLAERLPDAVCAILENHNPAPSLLHGDLWGGNCGFDDAGAPVVYDPAVYFGDCEAELAMTRLFGSLPDEFHVAYQQHHRLPDGWQLRASVYNLYHILNHLNIFGTAYLSPARHLMNLILSESR